jgi:hypothetical protein
LASTSKTNHSSSPSHGIFDLSSLFFFKFYFNAPVHLQ